MTAMPIVTVRYFAAASEAAGREEEELTLDADATIGTLSSELLRRYGDPMAHRVGRRVDVLPPFAGG